jgi:hypothetical protein
VAKVGVVEGGAILVQVLAEAIELELVLSRERFGGQGDLCLDAQDRSAKHEAAAECLREHERA